ncbi:MAG: hypothetical protein ACXVWW_04055 [Nocardioides sp.]
MRRDARGVPVVLVAIILSACAPGTPDEDSWRVDALRSIGDVSSSVSSVQLALQHHDRLFGPYLQTVAVQAEDAAGTASTKLSAVQPPEPYQGRSDTVTSALDDAESLLTDARIAVVRRDSAAYADLVRRLKRTGDRLSRLEDRVRALPDDRSRP